MGVFYDVRVHLAESSDDYQGKKSSTVAMGIRKVKCSIVTHSLLVSLVSVREAVKKN